MRFRTVFAWGVLVLSSVLAKADTFHFTFTPTAAGQNAGFSTLSFNLNSSDPISPSNSVSFGYSNVLVSSGGMTKSEFVSFGHDAFYEFAVGSAVATINPGNTISTLGGYTADIFTNGVIFSGGLSSPTFNPGSYTGGTGVLTITQVAATPEPSSLALLATGLAGVGGVLRRRLI